MGRTKGAKNKVKTKIVNVELQDDQIFIGDEHTQDTMMSSSTTNDNEIVYIAEVTDQENGGEDIVEFLCNQCKKVFETNEEYQVHSPCMVVYQVILPEDLVNEEDEKFKKPTIIKHSSKPKVGQYSESELDDRGYLVYCDPNPKNPCYCCGEDESTAHNGQVK